MTLSTRSRVTRTRQSIQFTRNDRIFLAALWAQLQQHVGCEHAIKRPELLQHFGMTEDRVIRAGIVELVHQHYPIASRTTHGGGWYVPRSVREGMAAVWSLQSRGIKDLVHARDLLAALQATYNIDAAQLPLPMRTLLSMDLTSTPEGIADTGEDEADEVEEVELAEAPAKCWACGWPAEDCHCETIAMYGMEEAS